MNRQTESRSSSACSVQVTVAEEKGYFEDEALDYVFDTHDTVIGRYTYRRADDGTAAGIRSTEEAPREVKQGAFEAMETDRTCDISAACHGRSAWPRRARAARCGGTPTP